MNYIFFDIFNLLNNRSRNSYKDFILLESNLENKISKKINDFLKESKNYNKFYSSNKNNYTIFLLEVKINEDQKNENYPFYDCFYFSIYINEDYLYEIIKHKDFKRWQILYKYLEYYYNRKESNSYSLENLNLFNKTLNLLDEKYSHNILREDSEEIILKYEELYKNNYELINSFINFYNKVYKTVILSENNKLCDFFIDDNNNIGKFYKKIYLQFIKQQNKEIKDLINIKIEERIFNSNSLDKVNIQNITEDDIFLLKIPGKFPFIDIIFIFSYRDIVNIIDFKYFSQFHIDFYLLEEKIADILHKNKKLFNKNISNFVYKNEELIFENIDITTELTNIIQFEYIIK